MGKKKKKIELCKLCGNKIYLEKDSYVHMIDYKSGKFHMEGYYHNPCWHSVLHKQTLEKIKERINPMIQSLLSKKLMVEDGR